jgi:hypothetical protein
MAAFASRASSTVERRTEDVKEARRQARPANPSEEETMNRRRLVTVASLSLVLILGLIPMKRGQSQAPKSAYPLMAPPDQYLMADQNTEIALARSAAPEAISRDARILVLGSKAPPI